MCVQEMRERRRVVAEQIECLATLAHRGTKCMRNVRGTRSEYKQHTILIWNKCDSLSLSRSALQEIASADAEDITFIISLGRRSLPFVSLSLLVTVCSFCPLLLEPLFSMRLLVLLRVRQRERQLMNHVREHVFLFFRARSSSNRLTAAPPLSHVILLLFTLYYQDTYNAISNQQ